jgi:hypothetical protein
VKLSLRSSYSRESNDDAVRDYQSALVRYGGATRYNNFAWLVAIRKVSGRLQLQEAEEWLKYTPPRTAGRGVLTAIMFHLVKSKPL